MTRNKRSQKLLNALGLGFGSSVKNSKTRDSHGWSKSSSRCHQKLMSQETPSEGLTHFRKVKVLYGLAAMQELNTQSQPNCGRLETTYSTRTWSFRRIRTKARPLILVQIRPNC